MSKRTAIIIKLKKCNDTNLGRLMCPYVVVTSTPRTGFAVDYECSADGFKKIAGYVESDREMPKVPEWCPKKRQDRRKSA